MTSRSILSAVALTALATSACESSASEPSRPPGGPEGPPALVEVAPVRAGDMHEKWRLLGDVRASARAALASGASGAITRITVREGDGVKAGQLLVEVDPALPRARAQVAEAGLVRSSEALAQARRELKRVEALDAKLVAAVELERARSRISELEAEETSQTAAVAESRAQLALHRIDAPFAGVVSRREVDLGDWVRPGDPVLELVSTTDVELLVDAPSELFRYVKVGDKASFGRAGDGTAEVKGIVPALDRQTRTMRVRLVPKTGHASLVPGSAVDVSFSIDLSGQGVVVPEDALLVGPTSTRVMRMVDEKADPLDVTVIAKADASALVTADGLKVGDLVVVRGNERLRPGQPLRTKE